MQTVVRDLHFAARSFLRQPGFTAISLLLLALGTGTVTVIFSVVNTVLLRPLPYDGAERLTMIWSENSEHGFETYALSAPDFFDFRDQTEVLQGSAAFVRKDYNLTGDGEPVRVSVAEVDPSLFAVLRIRPEQGRLLGSGDEVAGANFVTVLGHDFWQRRYGAAPEAIGKLLILNEESYEIVGVTPPGFQFPDGADLWIPKTYREVEYTDRGRGLRYLSAIARLGPGVTLEQAQSRLEEVATRAEKIHPKNNAGWGVRLVPLHEQVVGGSRQSLLLLLAAVSFVFLIACINIASLVLARAVSREGEVSIRTVLGAHRRRLARQLMTESLLLALLGGVAGLVLARWGIQLVASGRVVELPRLSEVALDGTILAFTLALIFVVGLLFGLIPLRHASRLSLGAALKDRGVSEVNLGSRRFAKGLVVVQVAAALILLTGAGLLIRSLQELLKVDPGFRMGNLGTTSVVLPDDNPRRSNAVFVDSVLERLGAIPGVRAAAGTTTLPFQQADSLELEFSIEGRPDLGSPVPLEAGYDAVTPEYFEAMGIPVVAGRTFTEQDHGDGAPVILINEAMARRYWQGQEAVGEHIQLGIRGESPREIVGVVGDVRHFGLEAEVRPEMYVPYLQHSWPFVTFVIRTETAPENFTDEVRQAVWAVDKNRPLSELTTMEELLAASLSLRRLNLYFLGAFAAVALILAVVGIYGLMTYSVSQRSREVGIRMALGAQRSDILTMVIRQGLTLTLVGAFFGLLGALSLGRWMSSLVYRVPTMDPVAFVLTSLLLVGAAAIASLIPSIRAARIDPNRALRYQ